MDEIIILRNGKKETYHKYEDVPEKFDKLIKYYVEPPTPPHTEEEHNQIVKIRTDFNSLLKRAEKH